MRIITSLSELSNLSFEEKIRTYIPENISTAFPVAEYGEELMSIASRKDVSILLVPSNKQFLPEQLCLRTQALERLVIAANALVGVANGRFVLKIVDAFRPLSVQRTYFKEVSDEISAKESLTGQALWERVTQFIADPERCPPHTTGGALDCTLVDLYTNCEVNMGTPIDALSDQAQTFSPDISEEARNNRMILFSVMHEGGFVNLPTEWWHYSYGDQYWAAFRGEDVARYSSIEKLPD